MTVRTQYTPLGGGLDLASSPMAIRPGRLEQSLNVEEIFGQQGYRFIEGYERFDGRAAPSEAAYETLAFSAGSTAIAAGDTVTSAGGASALVVSVALASGSWAGGDAAGTLVLTSISGDWAAADAIRVGGVQRATAAGATTPSSLTDADYQTNLTAAREALRALIQKVPGEGAVLGVAVYRGTVYAVRNIVGSASATLWQSSAAGWVSVKAGLIASGAWRFKVANFSGASTTLALFAVDGKNRLLKWDGTTATKAAPIYGSEATSVSSVTVGTGAKNFTIVESARSWVAGDALTVWDAADAANSMSGTVTSYNSGTGALVFNATASTGAGTKTAWEIGKSDFSDKPFGVNAFKDHLFLSYPLGQLQSSNLGDPMTYTTTAALFGLGSDITGTTALRGAVFGVTCREKIQILQGSSTIDWTLGLHSEGVGAIADTLIDNVGNALFLDDKGVVSLQATQDFGDFQPAVMSRDVKRLLDPLIPTVVGARMVKGTNQYRLYFADGKGLRFTLLSGAPVPQPRDVSPARAEYAHTPTCFAAGVLADDAEALFFGTSDGYVMREDAGTSFDGAAIDYVWRLPFDHYKSPASKKRFHKLELELDNPDAVSIRFMQLFDYDDGVYGHSAAQSLEVIATGGQFDTDAWDTFTYSAAMHNRAEVNVSGVGRSQALLLVASSDFARPATLQGVTTQFTILGMQR